MKLSEYAKQLGVCYRTAWNYYKAGQIAGAYELPSGTIIVPDDINEKTQKYGVILYARTSSNENKHLLNTQVERLENYAISKGYKIKDTVKEIASGLNDERKKLAKILKENQYDKIIVENKDRLTRFGFNWFQILTNNRIEVINESENKDEDLIKDFASIIHCFCARLYGLRRSQNMKNKINKVIEENK